MKIRIHITKRNIMCAAAVAVISVLSHILSGISVFNMILFPALYFAVKNIEIELNEKYNWLFLAGVIGVGSVLTTWLIQYLLLVEDLRIRISNRTFFLNICCVLFVYLAVQIFTNRGERTCMISHILLLVFAGINYFVYDFRGNELTFGDFKSVSTGLSVASNYRFVLNAQAMNTILLTVVFIAGIRKLKIQCGKVWLMRILCFSLAVCSFVYVAEKTQNTVTETWEQKGSYQNGYLLNFVLSIRDSFVKKPEHYSEKLIRNLEKEYEDAQTSVQGKKPAVIVIMDESFADFSVLGDLKTNQEVTPFIDSLKENTIRGYALASVFGAKTPNSEWEFLTGNSMAYLPPGSVAYQQYLVEENAYSILDTMKKEDYTCVAMHPYYETGWSRDKVYPMLGFDEMYFLDDFDQSNLMRRYVSDAVMFDQVIKRYEEGKGKENLFLMGITMQNHGGYRDAYDNFKTDVYGTNVSYSDVNQYLSLAHQTDLAVKDLISYFSKEKEPVVICFFGDHQPSLNTAFYRRLNGKGLSGLTLEELEELYEVPFFIWTNYESESETVERTSLNFLSTMLLERAGIPLSPYQSFLSDLRKEVPAMNARAYYSNDRKRYVHYGEGSRKEEVWIDRYRILQYNGLFDNKNRSTEFFKHQQTEQEKTP